MKQTVYFLTDKAFRVLDEMGLDEETVRKIVKTTKEKGL